MSDGKVYLVGAGPGDPGLVTVRARELLARAEAVVYDYLIPRRLLEAAPAGAEMIYVGKRSSEHTMSQTDINRLLVDLGRRGKKVVRLKGGDPFVFGRGGEEALALVEAGIDFEIVPGVTSAVAAAAYAGIPVTQRGMTSCLGLVTGHETPDKSETSLDWASLAAWKGTLAFYMGVANVGTICGNLVKHGLAADTPAAVIQWGTTSRQRVAAATVGTLESAVQAAGLKPPAMIIVGAVVSLREQLQWFEKKPLFGRRIVVTRARAQASEFAAKLEDLGAEVIEAPAIRIERPADDGPLRKAAKGARNYDWIIFTSVNAVESFFDALFQEGLDGRALAGVRIAAIGPATAAELFKTGIVADCKPEKYRTSSIIEALAAKESLAAKRVLYPRADIAPKDLVDGLTERGAAVTDVVAYQNVVDNANAGAVGEMLELKDVHWITFTSSSTVENFLSAVDVQTVRDSGAGIASIGPSTSATLRRLGLPPTVEAETFTIDGLIAAMLEKA